jgi:hypothetical protein
MRGISNIKRGKTCDPHSALWMSLTLLAFPFVSLAGTIMGYGAMISFGLGAAGSLTILLIEWITCRRVWFMDPCMSKWLEHPHLTFRLLGFLGLILLLFLSFLVAGFLFKSSFDANVLRFILNRQCNHPQSAWFVAVCNIPESTPERAIDPVAAAIRTEAAKRLYPKEQLVTCAQKTINQQRDELTVIRSALVRCDQWVVGTLIRKPVSFQSTSALVMTKLIVQQDGSYAVQQWSDDPVSDEWKMIGEQIASSTLLEYNQGLNLDLIQRNLAEETAQRAAYFLSRE